MLTRVAHFYLGSFAGLSRDIWLLSIVTLINRAGTMVIPFLTVYLTQELQFSMGQAGIAMSFFGMGSVLGTYAGGWLTDRIGYFRVQFWSLFSSGLLFINLLWVTSFPGFCMAVFVLSLIGDAFRPASLAAIAAYSKPENRARSFSLIRLFINLGFSAGPALGGIIAAGYGFGGLFWVDGLTCMGAALFLLVMLKDKEVKEGEEVENGEEVSPSKGSFGDRREMEEEVKEDKNGEEVKEVSPLQGSFGDRRIAGRSAYRDWPYLVFIIFMMFGALAFLQFFATFPVYLRQELGLGEQQIGLLLALNGLIIVFIEMPFVHLLDSKGNAFKWITIGSFLYGFSFFVLNSPVLMNVVLITMVVLITFGEILCMPFTNVVAVNRAHPKRRGEYMALYGMSYSVAHIFGPLVGMTIAGAFGFSILWVIVLIWCLIPTIGFWWLRKYFAG